MYKRQRSPRRNYLPVYFHGQRLLWKGSLLTKPREESVSRSPGSEALVSHFVYSCVCLWVFTADVCALVGPYLYPAVDVGLQGSGWVCSLSTMKSFLKPVNNVKRKQRGEVEPPSWVPVPSLSLGLKAPARLYYSRGSSSSGKHRAQAWVDGGGWVPGAHPSLWQPAGLFIFLKPLPSSMGLSLR